MSYASTRPVVHDRSIGRGPIIPGVLFRTLGGTGELPVAD